MELRYSLSLNCTQSRPIPLVIVSAPGGCSGIFLIDNCTPTRKRVCVGSISEKSFIGGASFAAVGVRLVYSHLLLHLCAWCSQSQCEVARCIFLVHSCKFDNVAQFGCLDREVCVVSDAFRTRERIRDYGTVWMMQFFKIRILLRAPILDS